MAITKFSELRTAITDRIARADFTAEQLKECVALCEARIRRELRTTDQETKVQTIVLNAQFVAMPQDLAAVRSFTAAAGYGAWQLQASSPEQIVSEYQATTGIPKLFAIVGNEMMIGPIPDGSYSAVLVYYATVPSLVNDNDTNWVLKNHVDCYLYGSLLEAASRMSDFERASAYQASFAASIDAMRRAARDRRWSGPAPSVRPA